MYHSKDIADLRADVRANCVIFLDLCKEAGLPVLVTETVRDDEYQRYLAANGYAAKTATRPTEMEEYMDQATFNKMMDTYLAQLGTKPVSSWAAKDWAAAKAAGITDGSAPQRLITRQEAITMLERLKK